MKGRKFPRYYKSKYLSKMKYFDNHSIKAFVVELKFKI